MDTRIRGYAYDARLALHQPAFTYYAALSTCVYDIGMLLMMILPALKGKMAGFFTRLCAYDGPHLLTADYSISPSAIQHPSSSTPPIYVYTASQNLNDNADNCSFSQYDSNYDPSQCTTSASDVTMIYAYDANGNVTDLVGTNGEFLAQYQFDPYGNTISKTGTLADANPFRFSTKYLDAETGLYYYGYRYYQPEVGRWASRDPLGDEAFLSFQLSDLRSSKKKLRERQLRNASLQPLYLFVENRSSSEVDPLGLDNTGGGGENQVCCVTSPGSSPAPGPSLVCRTCANAVGANVLLQLSLNDIDGNDDVGGGNAFRHCLATCQSVRACGSGCARCFWDGRENPADPAGQQDLANNQVGYGIQGSCWDGCHNAWRNGQLTCQGLPCPPPP